MKIFIRTLRNSYRQTLWCNEIERSRLRDRLNDDGFYVLTGMGDSLDVYVTKEDDMPALDLFVRIINATILCAVLIWVLMFLTSFWGD